MAPHTRRSSFTDERGQKPSPAKSVLRWLKKAVGLAASHDHATGRQAHRGAPPRRHHARASTHRARVHSFSLPQDPTDPHSPESDTKRYFHTTGSKYAIVLNDEGEPRITETTTKAKVHTTRVYLKEDLPSPSHVLIVGASLSGLCLAQGLKRAGIPFTVFEGDAAAPSDDSCDGYHVHIDTAGYEALKAVLPDDTFDLFLRSAGQAFPDAVQLDASTGKRLSGNTLSQSQGANKLVFSVDRSALRAVLLHGLDEGTELQYKRVFKRYHVLPNKTVEVHFANGLFVRGSVLVGADGRASRVREQYAPERVGGLLDTDCCVMYGETPLTTGLTIANLASTSTTTLVTSTHQTIALRIEPLHVPGVQTAEIASAPAGGSFRHQHREKNHDASSAYQTVSWALLARTDQFLPTTKMTARDLDVLEPTQIARIARQATSNWHPLARAVVETSIPESCELHRLHTAPAALPSWAPSRVTLIGDAAHALIPSALATNLALQDATVLCERLVHLGVGVPAVAMYEKLMWLTAREAVLATAHAHRSLIGMPPLDRMAPVRVEKKTARRRGEEREHSFRRELLS